MKGEVKEGSAVLARWYDDPVWYRRRVIEKDGKLACIIEPGIIGYLEDAHEVIVIEEVTVGELHEEIYDIFG